MSTALRLAPNLGRFAVFVSQRCGNVCYALGMAQMTRDDMITELRRMGFRHLPTASRKWKLALHLFIASQTLIVLIRSRGVDIMLTPAPPQSCWRHLNSDPPCRSNIDPGRIAEFGISNCG